MSREKFRNNNKGAALILVIGCVALLSVIGALLLAKTANNRDMKAQEKKAQQAFYEAEGGTQIMVSALETCAQNALKSAYVDMLLQYSVQTEAERQMRFTEYFQTALKNQITVGASQVLKDSLGLTDAEFAALNLSVDFPVEPSETGNVVTDAMGVVTDTKVIKVSGATFSYTNPGDGTQTKLTTDICVQAKVPNLNGSMTIGSLGCAFTDFALINSGETSAGKENNTGGQIAKIDGNLYVGGDLLVDKYTTKMEIVNAAKALVKKTIRVQNSGALTINNSSYISSAGYGVWADGISVDGGGKLDATSNFYVADDLNISGTLSSAVFKGNGEYVGYNGNPTDGVVDSSAANSAITINTASKITMDMSQLARLVLRGNSYIYDTSKWQSGAGTEVSGILQGESVAYKDMQSMYLVPADCLPTKSNPMPRSEYDSMIAGNYEVLERIYEQHVTGGDPYVFDIDGPAFSKDAAEGTPEANVANSFLDENKPFVTRFVVLDGGATEFAYVYLNFASLEKASSYVQSFLASPVGSSVKERLNSLGQSTVKLAANNQTVSNILSYTENESGVRTYSFEAGDGATTGMRMDCLQATINQTALFSTLNIGGVAASDVEDIVTDAILVENAFQTGGPGAEIGSTLTEVASIGTGDDAKKFYVVNPGDGNAYTIGDGTTKQFEGILLVHGNLKVSSTNTHIKGLVIATGDVEFTQGATFEANKEVVEALLELDEVAEYFRGYSAGGSSSYLSTEAVTISFENWQKN